MASSSSAGFNLNPLFGLSVSEKLSKNNFALWEAQVLAALRGARLEGFITGSKVEPSKEIDGKVDGKEAKVSNPAYEEWVATDQQILSFLLTSVSRDVFSQVTRKKTSADAWKAIRDMYAS